MPIVPIERLREHCKTDGDDDDMLAFYGAAAERNVAAALNRPVFADQADWDTAILDIPTKMADAQAAYDAAVLALGADDLEGHNYAYYRRESVRRAQHAILDGIIANEDIENAILLIAGHLYRNREANVVGVSVSALPYGIDALLGYHRKLGWTP